MNANSGHPEIPLVRAANRSAARPTQQLGELHEQGRCISCGRNELLRVPPTPGDHSHIVTGERLLHTVSIVTYVCIACGHVEQWVNGEAELERLRSARARQPDDVD
jgi:hypothetical protein